MEETGDFKSSNEEQRRWAIIDASSRADASALPTLLSVLADETEANRRHIARALGNIGGETCEARLLAMLETEAGIILGDVARSLGQLKSEAALERLRGLLKHEADWVRSNCRWAIKQIEGTHNQALHGTVGGRADASPDSP